MLSYLLAVLAACALVHPSGLMYSEIFLRLEPLGLERVAGAARAAGHQVRLLDLQVFSRDELARELRDFAPDAVGFSLNYLANVPEVIDLARAVKAARPGCFVFTGGHSVSFIARHVLDQADGAIDAIVRGEGEAIIAQLLAAAPDGQLHRLPGVVTAEGGGPPPIMLDSLDDCPPARDLTRRRRKYFIAELDPCASVEFTRGCPWDCSFCHPVCIPVEQDDRQRDRDHLLHGPEGQVPECGQRSDASAPPILAIMQALSGGIGGPRHDLYR